jgi:hypothetical protein
MPKTVAKFGRTEGVVRGGEESGVGTLLTPLDCNARPGTYYT